MNSAVYYGEKYWEIHVVTLFANINRLGGPRKLIITIQNYRLLLTACGCGGRTRYEQNDNIVHAVVQERTAQPLQATGKKPENTIN